MCCSPWGRKESDTTERPNSNHRDTALSGTEFPSWDSLSSGGKWGRQTICQMMINALETNKTRKGIRSLERMARGWFRQVCTQTHMNPPHTHSTTKAQTQKLLGKESTPPPVTPLAAKRRTPVFPRAPCSIDFLLCDHLEGGEVSYRQGLNKSNLETSVVVQWLRFQGPNTGDLGSIPGQGTYPHATTKDPTCRQP